MGIKKVNYSVHDPCFVKITPGDLAKNIVNVFADNLSSERLNDLEFAISMAIMKYHTVCIEASSRKARKPGGLNDPLPREGQRDGG